MDDAQAYMGQKKSEYSVVYHPLVADDTARIDNTWQQKIIDVIERKLATQPDMFGVPLRQSLKGYRKLRAGDYRVIYRIENKIVKIIVIKHRSVVYKSVKNRI